MPLIDYPVVGNITKIHIGDIGVDSGQVMVGDPCYLRDFTNDEYGENPYTEDGDYTFSYSGCCEASSEGGGELGRWQGVVSYTAYGDGVYPVYQLVDEVGTVTGLFIDFVGTE